MNLSELNWTRKEYDTWDEAFRGLVPAVRQQSVRVASYTQALFVQACEDGFGADTKEGADRMKGQYADLAYKCGIYHQLGKALVPPEYQQWQEDFTEEEKAVYRKYTTDGRLLVATLQERTSRARFRRKGEFTEQPTDNIPQLMLRESCQQHMERYNGSGYPEGRMGANISPIAQIVGIAKELDRLASETKSENPFDEAYRILISQADVYWSPALIEVLKAARGKCRAVWRKYIEYTQTLPHTIPLVDKRKDRPMGLTYRPMAADTEGTVAAYEAIPWFGGINGQPGERESAAEVAPMLQRTNLINSVTMYLLYEAADAVLRIQNCKLNLQGILLQVFPEFYTPESQLAKLTQLFEDQKIDRSRLMLTLPAQVVENATKGLKEVLERYLRNGIVLVLDGYRPDVLPPEDVKAMGFTHLRMHPELYLQQSSAEWIKTLRAMGFTLVGGGADTYDVLAWLAAAGVAYSSGTICGVPVTEDDLIRDCLARER